LNSKYKKENIWQDFEEDNYDLDELRAVIYINIKPESGQMVEDEIIMNFRYIVSIRLLLYFLFFALVRELFYEHNSIYIE
jgi:hypothetical protein